MISLGTLDKERCGYKCDHGSLEINKWKKEEEWRIVERKKFDPKACTTSNKSIFLQNEVTN